MSADAFWQELNTLLALLREFQVVLLVDQHFRQYGNFAPAELLHKQIQVMRARMDEHRKQAGL